ncbi:flagellar basal body rod protein FlgF [Legionella dresdenensis]|uniref:Flagellar basal-body rod protein FlgF n=1 Tax=Legionella dresdenensis TaxID=450200 RepID=A0ABV8CBV8_9GAMM
MEPMLYTAMNGAQTDLSRQMISSNNMANVNTPGFKEDIFAAESVYLTNTEGLDTGVALVVEEPNNTSVSPGPIMTTGRDLDVAVGQVNGWFAVGTGNGTEAYTRNGSFKLNANGLLTTTDDLPVLGDGGPISIPPAQKVDIGTDGTISIVPLGGTPLEVVIIDRLKLVSLQPNQVYKNAAGLMQTKQGGNVPPDPNLTVVSGALEGSNVNAVEQMIDMIAANREFEGQIKVMQTADDNAQQLAQILQE